MSVEDENQRIDSVLCAHAGKPLTTGMFPADVDLAFTTLFIIDRISSAGLSESSAIVTLSGNLHLCVATCNRFRACRVVEA
jgi:hypothetical protein